MIENPEWKGSADCTEYVKNSIFKGCAHLFGVCDPSWCKHEGPVKKKSGHVVTCKRDIAIIKQIFKNNLLYKLHQIVVANLGTVDTNDSEKVGSVVSIYRRKDRFYKPHIEVNLFTIIVI